MCLKQISILKSRSIIKEIVVSQIGDVEILLFSKHPIIRENVYSNHFLCEAHSMNALNVLKKAYCIIYPFTGKMKKFKFCLNMLMAHIFIWIYVNSGHFYRLEKEIIILITFKTLTCSVTENSYFQNIRRL
jgi:hypothetical protein